MPVTTRQLRSPESAREALARRWRSQQREWLTGGGQWPLSLGLGSPSEEDACRHPDAVRAWVSAWGAWKGPGEVLWCERRWRSLGTQSLPERLVLHGPEEVAACLGETARWQLAQERYHHLAARWPELADALPRFFDLLSDYAPEDLSRLETVLAWLQANPGSNLYPRQLPIAGMDSKWIETHRTPIATLLSLLQGATSESADFYERCGLKPLPATTRVRLLDEPLRSRLGGLGDVTAPIDDLAQLDLPVERVFIVENLQTGLAFGPLPGSVVFMALGYGVDVLGRLPWVTRAECYYWGDLDTHGFAILSRARSHLPQLRSLLMDEQTLLRHKELWCKEDKQHAAAELPYLTDPEQSLYRALKHQLWATNLRLEQERIAWNEAWQLIQAI